MLKFVFAILLLLGLSPALLGANGAWTNTASGGNWSNAANWTNRIIADGPGSTATFDLALSAVNTVTLDTARTNLNLVFGNASTKDGANWTIAGSSAWTFDNSGPTPTISCWPLLSSGNSAVTLNPSIVSSLGFANLGTGTLWLKGNNSGLGGTLTIARGRIFNYSPTGIGNAAVVISNGCYLSFWTGGEFTNSSFVLNGLGQTQDGQLKSALYVDNGGVNSVILDGTVTLNALSDMGCSATNESITLNGAVSGPGGLVENGHGGTLTLAGLAKSYTGPTLVSNGVLAVNAELVASRVTNYSGTLLSGTGRIDSSAYVFGGATVTPAGVNFSGTLSVSNLTCQAGATLEFDLTPLNNIEGSGINDELLVTNLTFNGTVTNQINFYTTATPVSGRYILLRYSGSALGLTNLVLPAAFLAQSYQPTLDFSVPGQVGLVIAAGSSMPSSQPRRSGIFYSTLFAKIGQYVRIQAFGTNAAQLFLRDVNGDGHDDAVAYFTNETQLGQWNVALGNGQTFTNPTVMVTFPAATPAMKPLMADINGDGRADACLFDPATGSWWVALSNGTNFSAPTLFSTGNGVGSTDQFLADVNGDGRADALVYFNTGGLAGKWYVGLSSGLGFGSFTTWLSGFDTNSTQRLVGDVNGDGKADVAAFAQSSGNWNVALSSVTAFGSSTLWLTNSGTNAEQAFLFDLDRDGRADAVYVRADNADWWATYSTGSAFSGGPDRAIAGLNLAYPKEGYPGPQAKLPGSLNRGIGCACAIILGNWFAIEHPNKYSTQSAAVMDTWSCWGNNYIPQLPGAVGTYDSGDPAINDEQTGMIHDAGFDYLMFDDTNGNTGWVDSRIASFITRLRRWNQNRTLGQHPIYFCISKGGSRGKSNWQQVIEQESQFAWTNWYAPNPDTYYTLAGKPLLIHFVWDPSYSSNFLAWTGDKTYSSRFTIRWMYNAVANDPSYANCYGWQVAAQGGNPAGGEVMDVMPGFWNGGTFTSRANGSFYQSQWLRVLQFQPGSVWVNSWNETWEHTSVEPAWLHGRWLANAGITPWNDYYGNRTDNFYYLMTRQYNWLFRNNALYEGAYVQESGSTNVYLVSGSNFVTQTGLPYQAPLVLVPAGFRTSFSGAVVTTNFTGWSSPASLYDFDEPSGTTDVDSLGGLNGQNYGGVTRGWGVSGNALVTDGVSGYARLPQNLVEDFSLVLWMNTSSAGASATNWWQGQVVVTDEAGSATNGFGLTVLSGGRLAFGTSTTGLAVTVQSLSAISNGAWHQASATRDSITGELRLYVDGLLQGSAYGTPGLLATSGYLRLGGGPGATSFLAGSFDTLQIYNQVLSAPMAAVLTTNPPAGCLVSGPWASQGRFVARFAGLPGQTYVVQTTDQLSPPHWQATTNLTAPAVDQGLGVGVFEFATPIAPVTSRFYRLQMQAP